MLKKIYSSLLIKYLILAFPVLLISGPLLPEISLFIILILLIIEFSSSRFKILNNNFLYGFCIFNILILLSAIFSEYSVNSIIPSLFYFRFLIIVFAVLYILEQDKNFLGLLKNILLFTFVILIFDGFYQYIFKVNIIGLANININRISSFFGKELIYGSYLARFLPILIGLMILYQKKQSDKLLIYFILILSISAIFISGERAALFLSLLSTFIILFSTNFFSKTKILVLFICSGIFFSFLFTNDYIKFRLYENTFKNIILESFNKTTSYKGKNYPLIINEKYTYMTLSAYKMFQTKPFLGHGIKSFRKNCKVEPYKFEKYDGYNNRLNCSTHPHNIYMQLLSETGLLSFIIVLLYFFYISYQILINFIKRKEQKLKKLFDFKVCILSCIFINLFPFITTGSFFNNWLSMVYFFPIGFLLYLNKVYKL